MIRQLDDRTFISAQIRPDDVPQLKQFDIDLIINNRPDGEEASQPLAVDIEAAASAAGIAYRAVPIAKGIGPSEVEEMRQALEATDGNVLAYCKSGQRSALVWALARRAQGASVAELRASADEGGIDLTPIAHLL
jgi:uncharacterized protein (TIGR01244 family)